MKNNTEIPKNKELSTVSAQRLLTGKPWTPEQLSEANQLIKFFRGEESIAVLKRAYVIYCVHRDDGWKAHGHNNITEWANEMGMSRPQCFRMSALGSVATPVLRAIAEMGLEGVDVSKLMLMNRDIKDNVHDHEKIKELVHMTKTHGYRDIQAMQNPPPAEFHFQATISKITRTGKTIEFNDCVHPIDIGVDTLWQTFRNIRVKVYVVATDDG